MESERSNSDGKWDWCLDYMREKAQEAEVEEECQVEFEADILCSQEFEAHK